MKYIVKSGDTLYGIASDHGITQDALQNSNSQLIDPTTLPIGHSLAIPNQAIEYIIKPGDTLYSLAHTYGITQSDLQASNPQLIDPTSLPIGLSLTIPNQVIKYIVKPGDTLYSIAGTHGITQETLQNSNPQLIDPTTLPIGLSLTISDDVRVSGTCDAATNECIVANNCNVDSVVEPCPINAPWFTIKPVRYAVVNDDSEFSLPEKLSLASSLPKLTKHKYIARELIDHTVYLYNENRQYLLEIKYKDGKANQCVCVFSQKGLEPEPEVTSAFPLIRQKRGAKVSMWLTQIPLSISRKKSLKANPAILSEIGQKINFSNAVAGSAADTRLLSSINDVLAEYQKSTNTAIMFMDGYKSVKQVKQVKPTVSSKSKKVAEDNHYIVCLIDAIGITNTLCQEFSVCYEGVMQSYGAQQGLYQLTTLTREIIDRCMNKAIKRLRETYPTYRREDRLFENITITTPEGAEIPWYPDNDDQIAMRRLALEKIKRKLNDNIYRKEMDEYLDKYEKAILSFKPNVESLAKDWLTWLDHDQIDLALAWLDDTVLEQIELKVMCVAGMTNNIEVTDAGVALRDKWINVLFAHFDGNASDFTGAGAHVVSSLGYTEESFAFASTFLYKLSFPATSATAAEISKARKATLAELKPSSYADFNVQSFVGEIARKAIKSGKAVTWEKTFSALSSIYHKSYDFTMAKLADVQHSAELTIAAGMAEGTNKKVSIPGPRINLFGEKTVKLYDIGVEKAGVGVGKLKAYTKGASRFFVNQIVGSSALDDHSSLMDAYKKSRHFFENKTVGGGTFGFIWAVQVYNVFQLSSQLKKSKSKDKKAFVLTNTIVSFLNSSISLTDFAMGKQFIVAGSEEAQSFSTYMAKDGAKLVGDKVTSFMSKGVSATLGEGAVELGKLPLVAGKGAAIIIKASFKALPIIGSLLSFAGSWYQFSDDKAAKQNSTAIAISVLSMIANFGASTLAIAVCFNPAVAPYAAVFMVASLLIDGIHMIVEDNALALRLKTSFWGKESDKFNKSIGVNTLQQRLTSVAKASEGSEVEKAVKGEIFSFCDFLFKPIAMVENFKKVTAFGKHNGGKLFGVLRRTEREEYTHMTLKIILPGFVPGVSDVTLGLKGMKGESGEVLLATDSFYNAWKHRDNKLDAKMTQEGPPENPTTTLKVTINEFELSQDYESFELTLKYKSPNSYPVELNYPYIKIDDDKKFLGLYSLDSAVDDFYIENKG